jgi:hypothetical protein
MFGKSKAVLSVVKDRDEPPERGKVEYPPTSHYVLAAARTQADRPRSPGRGAQAGEPRPGSPGRGAQADEPRPTSPRSPGRLDAMAGLGKSRFNAESYIKNTALSIYKCSTAPGSLLHTLG